MDIQQQKPYKVLLIGESCIDVYAFGKIDRHYSESKIDNVMTNDVPIFNVAKSVKKDGMALNVKKSLSNLGCDVVFLTNKKIIEKKRYILEETQKHFMRSDEHDTCDPISNDQVKKLSWNDYDFVVVSDYNKGAVTGTVIKTIVENFKGHIFVDTKKTDLSIFENCIIKINQFEKERVVSFPKNYQIIVTIGEKGAIFKEKPFSAYPVSNVLDICGAGDNFLVGLALMMQATDNMEKSIEFANYCSSLCIEAIGNKPITKQDVKNYVKD